MTIEMMRDGWFAPTINLETPIPLRAAGPHRRRGVARHRVRDEQQFRVRRHQYVADLPPLDRSILNPSAQPVMPLALRTGSVMAFAAMAPPVSRWMSAEELGRLAAMRSHQRAEQFAAACLARGGCWR
jgi:hypothetical protein